MSSAQQRSGAEEPEVTDVRSALRRWAAEQSCGCGHVGLVVMWRLTARPIGEFSLAGTQPKVSANEWPWLMCPACGAEAPGKAE